MAESGNTREARRLVEEVVGRDDATLTEALLASAIRRLADEVDELRRRLDAHKKGISFA